MTLLATDSMQVALQTEDNYVQTKLKALIKTNNIKLQKQKSNIDFPSGYGWQSFESEK